MTTYQPPKGLKPGDTVRVVTGDRQQLRTVATVGRKWLTLVEDTPNHRPRRIDMVAGEYERDYLGSSGPARVYRPDDPAGWADAHRGTIASLHREARRVASASANRFVQPELAPADEARAVIDAYTRLLAAIAAEPARPEDA